MFFFQCYGDHRDLHSFPTRRSSDLSGAPLMLEISGCAERTPSPGGRIARGTAPHTMLPGGEGRFVRNGAHVDRKSTRLNSSHVEISYAVFCLKKKKKQNNT